MNFNIMTLTAALGLAMVTQSAVAAGQLNMICSAPQPVCDAVVGEFSNQKAVNVNMIRMSTGEVYARLRAEARNPKSDIWFSGTHEPHYQAADEDLTYAHRPAGFDNLNPLAQKMAQDTDYKAHANGVVAVGFVWNEEVLRQKNLPEPTSWADLLKPEYQGEIALSNPNTAGTGYSILVALVELMGEDAAFDYLKKLNANVSNYTKSGSAVGGLAARGEVSIGVMFSSDSNMLVRQGFPMKIVHPSEGTGYALDSMSIIRGAKNLDEAKEFVDWVLTPQAQSINIKIENGVTYHPTANGAEFSDYTMNLDGVKLLEMDQRFYGSPETRKALLTRWDREIGAIAGK